MKQYGTAYVTQPTGHSFSPILDYCTDLKFITTGYEEEKELEKIFDASMKNFDPEFDVIVPVGSVSVNFLLGLFVQKLMKQNDYKFVNVAIYHEKKYTIYSIEMELEEE